MRVIFDGRRIENGEYVDKYITRDEPIIEFLCDKNKLYTILMYDRDADFLHWLVVNMDCSFIGDTIVKYMGPNPPSGVHRYYIIIYEQEKKIYPQVNNRANFNLSQFTNGLNKIDQSMFKVTF